jgi:hypothetical protein
MPVAECGVLKDENEPEFQQATKYYRQLWGRGGDTWTADRLTWTFYSRPLDITMARGIYRAGVAERRGDRRSGKQGADIQY